MAIRELIGDSSATRDTARAAAITPVTAMSSIRPTNVARAAARRCYAPFDFSIAASAAATLAAVIGTLSALC